MRNRLLLMIMGTAALVGVILYLFVFKPEEKQVLADPAAPGANGKGTLLINEVMASNPDSVPDEQGLFPDWFELYNAGKTAVNLSGFGVTDEPTAGAKYVFPSYDLKPGAYVLVYCDDTKDRPFHAPFKLKADQDTLQLLDSAGTALDTVAILPVPGGYTFGREVGQPSNWVELSMPTPGYSNDEAGRAAYELTRKAEPTELVINEFQSANKTTITDKAGVYSDWIELYNPSSKAIDISNFGLSDDKTRPIRWKFPEGTKVEPGEYKIIFCDGGIALEQTDELHASFKLSSFTGSVVLSDMQGRIIQSVDYKEIPTDASFGRESGGEWGTMTAPTPGYSNDEEGHIRLLEGTDNKPRDVYISEVMLTNDKYAEDNKQFYDWIELHNGSSADVDLSGYGITDNTANPGKYRFAPGTVLRAGAYMVLQATGDKSTSESYLHLPFALNNNDGQIVSLWNAQDQLMDKVNCAHQYNFTSYGRDADGVLKYYANPTPGAANAQGYVGYTPMPEILLKPGFYQGSQTLAVNVPQGAQVYYTTDGSEPSESSTPYAGEMTFDKTASVRFRAYQPDRLPSRVATGSYLLNSPHSQELSVVMVSVDPDAMFNPTTGIYSMGPNAQAESPFKGANFWQETELSANVQIFSTDGTQELDQDVAFRIFGAYSRAREQKGFAIIARSEFDDGRLYAPLFSDRPYDDYKSIVLRAGAQDSTVTKLKDIIATSLVDANTNLEVQAYRQAVLYINGQYFGVYNIREKVNKHFLQQHYGVDPENIDLLVGNGTVLGGDSKDYKDLIAYCESRNLSDPQAYEYVASRVDIDNYIDYIASQMYIANTDTGNIKWFRERKEGSKYRWIYYDFCWSMLKSDLNSVERLTNPQGHGVGKGFSTQLTRSLLQNQDFRNQFLRRFAELLNTIYKTENVMARIELTESRIYDEMERDLERWPEGISVGNWKSNIKVAKKFVEQRPGYMVAHLQKYFQLSDAQTLEIFGMAGTKGE